MNAEKEKQLGLAPRPGMNCAASVSKRKDKGESNTMTTKSVAKHTPGEWKVDTMWGLIMGPKGEEIAAVHAGTEHPRLRADNASANADFIVRACNSHKELLEAVKSLASIVDCILNADTCPDNNELDKALTLANEVIRKAESR